MNPNTASSSFFSDTFDDGIVHFLDIIVHSNGETDSKPRSPELETETKTETETEIQDTG